MDNQDLIDNLIAQINAIKPSEVKPELGQVYYSPNRDNDREAALMTLTWHDSVWDNFLFKTKDVYLNKNELIRKRELVVEVNKLMQPRHFD